MSININFTTATSSSNYNPEPSDTLYNSLIINNIIYTSPVSLSFVSGSSITIQAVDNSQTMVGELWNWVNWSDNGAQTHSITANGANTTYIANFTLSPQIYADIDPIIFFLTNYSSTILDNNNNKVPFTTQYPDAIMNMAVQGNPNVFPIVSVNPGSYTTEWAAIGAYRLRYYQDLELIVWATTPDQRFVIERRIRKHTTTINKKQLAANYVFMYHPYNSYPDEVNLFGSPIYRTKLPLRIIYDILRPT